MKNLTEGEELIERVNRIGGLIFGVSENRSWIELFYEGDHTHIKSVELPGDIPLFDIFVEEIPHKATIYEHPRIMIHLAGPCDLEIVRDGNKIIIRGRKVEKESRLKKKRPRAVPSER